MERHIYVNTDFCAVEENRRLVEYIPVRNDDQTGEILYGRINRIMSGLQAAFVDIGRKKDGFLPLSENSNSFIGGSIKSGDRVLVQIRKEENGTKGAFLTRDLSIPGCFMIFMPMNRHIGISARITDQAERERMMQKGKELAGDQFGLVMRASSENVSDEELRNELANLKAQWAEIQVEGQSQNSVESDLIRDYSPRGIQKVIRDELLPPDLIRQKKEAQNRRIPLPHGGNIVIDRCEAMTVIDVNSASDSGKGNLRETILQTNLEACREIMIQTRLRNLSGILIIDMIDMESMEDRRLVQKSLETAFQEDRIKTVVHGYTSLGLIEMTRKRSRATW